MTRRRAAAAARSPRRDGRHRSRWRSRSLADLHLHELFAGFALMGVLASQRGEPNRRWVRRWSWRIACDMAKESDLLRRRRR